MGRPPIPIGCDDHPVTPVARPASTVCLIRDGSGGIEVLMVQRGADARFMAGAWVFPGGVVDEVDGTDDAGLALGDIDDEDRPWAAAALRELAEEVGIWLTRRPVEPGRRLRGVDVFRFAAKSGLGFDVARLAYFANWFTPEIIPIRFDTRFYAVTVEIDSIPQVDPSELAAAEWIEAGRALAAGAAGRRVVPLPTMENLKLIAGFDTTAHFMSYAAALSEVEPVLARGRVTESGAIEAVLPWDPGYDELEDAAAGSAPLSEAARANLATGHLVEPAAMEPPADEG